MAGERPDRKDSEHWRRKYYDSLDELEEREKEWTALESQLRKLATRLSLAADQYDNSFSHKLDQLRDTLRNEKNPLRLGKIIDDVVQTISRLDMERQDHGEVAPRKHDYARLLDSLNIPDSLQRQERYVRKNLARYSDENIDEAVKDMVELLSLIIDVIASKRAEKQPTGETAEQEAPQAGKNGETGLLASLFRRRESRSEEKPASENMSARMPEAQAATEAEAAEQSSLDTELNYASETLIHLLEKLRLPDDLYVQADLIKARLQPCADPERLLEGLESTADVILEMSQRVQQEKRELEAFLLQLTERLQDLDEDIRETAQLREQTHEAGVEINRSVKQEVSNIEQSVSEALDLDKLKTSVQSRVIIIRDHMDRFMEAELDRNDRSSRLVENLRHKLSETENEVSQLREQVEQARAAAMRDQLTGINNRLAYDQRIHDELARFERYESVFSLMVWDVDKFKDINDTYGHAAGDKVLTIIANTLNSNVRETDMVARYGGEEFIVLLPETRLDQTAPLAEKLRSAIEETAFHFKGKRVVITASCGVAEVQKGDDDKSLFSRADEALYRAKQQGRNRVVSNTS